MNAEKRHNPTGSLCCTFAVWLAVFVSGAKAASPREMLKQGNGLYGDGRYTEAINKYNDALVERPEAVEPRFNKANSYFKLDDLGEAVDLYQEVAAESKDMNLVAKAKYNLGNAFFQRGVKQRDSDLQKAVEDMKTSITHWRQVLDIDPKNEKAARNIEVARLTIKDILDQIKQQQKDQQNQQDPNQPQQGQQQQQQQQDSSQSRQDPNQPQQGQQQQQQQDSSQSRQDPNQPQDPNQAKPADQPQDPNQTKEGAKPNEPNQPQDQQEQSQQPAQGQDKQQEQKIEPDATAQQIIDNEQRQKKEREIRQRARYQQVEKDW